MNKLFLGFLLSVGCTMLWPAGAARAHWCSNIYQTYARIVVKPERQNINVGVGETGSLKVRVRNNFPYTLYYVRLRANNPTGLTVTVSPTDAEAQNIRVYSGQEVTFTLGITRNQAGPDDVSNLNLQVNTTVQDIGPSWRNLSDWWIHQDPAPADLRNKLANDPDQVRALLNATLADRPCLDCELDGVNGLLELWHTRLDSCESGGFDSQWPMMYMRAGQALAIRLRFRAFNDPSRANVVQNLIETMDDAYGIVRGYAAFLAAYGGNDAGVASRIQQMADSDTPAGICSFSPSSSAQRMAKAALLILGNNQYQAEVTACSNDGGEHNRARMVCAAALGLMGDDAPITNFLIPRVPDGTNTDYERLFGSYLLQLVVFARRGGPEGVGLVSFLDEEVVSDDVPPKAPANLRAGPPS